MMLVLAFTARAVASPGDLSVVTSFFPAYDFARQIGGDKVEARLLLPPGVEAHAFAPTPRDMVRINGADIFFHGGLIMEPWVNDLIQGLDHDELLVIDTSGELDHHSGNEKPLLYHDEYGHEYENNLSHHADPHFWLDPVKALVLVDNILAALVRSDPPNADYYQEQAGILRHKIEALDQDIKHGLADCRSRTIVSGGHFAFGHFCRRYNLEVLSAYKGFSPDAAPSPRDLTHLIRFMKKAGSRAVFHEELLQPKIARIIAEETGAELLLLHGAHNLSKDERKRGETYLSIMAANLKRLQQGLQCQ